MWSIRATVIEPVGLNPDAGMGAGVDVGSGARLGRDDGALVEPAAGGAVTAAAEQPATARTTTTPARLPRTYAMARGARVRLIRETVAIRWSSPFWSPTIKDRMPDFTPSILALLGGRLPAPVPPRGRSFAAQRGAGASCGRGDMLGR